MSSEKEANAIRVLQQLNEIIEAGTPKLEKYHKGGMKAELSKTIYVNDWSEACLSTLTLAQSFGRSWTLTGDIERELYLVADQFKLPGIEWAELALIRQ